MIEIYEDDKKGGVDRSSTVIAKDPEGKNPQNQFTQLTAFIFSKRWRTKITLVEKSAINLLIIDEDKYTF